MWEIAIKHAIGKLTVSGPLAPTILKHVNDNSIALLPVRVNDALAVADLPHHHKDPFDRLLVAQCLAEDLPIVSADESWTPTASAGSGELVRVFARRCSDRRSGRP